MEKHQKSRISQKHDIPVKKAGRNLFADLALPNADELQLKAELTRQIYRRIKDFGLNQTEAAKRLSLKQPDVSKLMNGTFTGFSTDRLLSLLTDLEFDIEIIVRPRDGKPEHRGTIRVLTEAA